MTLIHDKCAEGWTMLGTKYGMPVADVRLQTLIKITKVRKESNYEP